MTDCAAKKVTHFRVPFLFGLISSFPCGLWTIGGDVSRGKSWKNVFLVYLFFLAHFLRVFSVLFFFFLMGRGLWLWHQNLFLRLIFSAFLQSTGIFFLFLFPHNLERFFSVVSAEWSSNRRACHLQIHSDSIPSLFFNLMVFNSMKTQVLGSL